MRIVRRVIQRSGIDIAVAFIDTEGLDLGIDTVLIEPDYTIAERVVAGKRSRKTNDDDDDNDFDDDDDTDPDVPPVLEDNGVLDLNKIYFLIETFRNLKDNTEDGEVIFFGAVNLFFSQLSDDERRKFCLFYISARRTIDSELSKGTLVDIAKYLGNKVYDLMTRMNIPNRLLHFVEFNSGIPIPDLSYAGTRVGQDTEAMTFHLPDYHRLLAISIICKMLCPIWGDLIYRTKTYTDNTMKETYCMDVIEPLLSVDTFLAVRHKLFAYIANTVKQSLSSIRGNASFTASVGGISLDRFNDIVFATIIVKRYVNVDLYKQNPIGNIMIWTQTCAKSSFNSLLSTLNNRCRIMPRTEIVDTHESGDDERNVSVLEYGSRVTSVTADIPILIKFGVKMSIRNLCKTYNVSERDFQLMAAFYQQNPIQVTVLNKTLVGILLGNVIGGAQGLKYLNTIDYMDLVIITQIYLAHTGYHALVHLLTASTPDEMKTAPSTIDNRISMDAEKYHSYSQLETAFPYAINGIGISGVSGILRRVQDYIIKYNHFTNTAPTITMMMDLEPPHPGSLIEYDESVMDHFYRVILDILAIEKHTAMGV